MSDKMGTTGQATDASPTNDKQPPPKSTSADDHSLASIQDIAAPMLALAQQTATRAASEAILRAKDALELGKENTKARIAFSIVAFYLLMILIILVLLLFGRVDMSVAKDINSTFLTPILGLAGMALGYYFGIGAYSDISRRQAEPKENLSSPTLPSLSLPSPRGAMQVTDPSGEAPQKS